MDASDVAADIVEAIDMYSPELDVAMLRTHVIYVTARDGDTFVVCITPYPED